MSLPAPPYVVKEINSAVDQDDHGNSGAFITVEPGGRCLLRMKGPFPIVGDRITDRVLVEKRSQSGNTYLKLEKQSQNGAQGRSGGSSQDGPDEAYWAGQNAAKGRSAAQARAIDYAAVRGVKPELSDLAELISWFEKDVHAARDKAVEAAAAQPGGASSHTNPPRGGSAAQPPPEPPPHGISERRQDPPTDKQTAFMLKLARERGLSGDDMKRLLGTLGVEQFSQLEKKDCVDKWKQALGNPVPDPSAPSDIPTDWPPDAPHEWNPDPSTPDDQVPF